MNEPWTYKSGARYLAGRKELDTEEVVTINAVAAPARRRGKLSNQKGGSKVLQRGNVNRRDFIWTAGLSAAGLAVGRTMSAHPVREGRVINFPRELGTYYQAVVPDTLDLAERGRLGLQHFDAITDEKLGYEMYEYSSFTNSHPPYLVAGMSPLTATQAKALEATAFERLMSGSTLNLDREAKMVEMMVSLLGPDGLHWVSADLKKKPWMRIGEPFVMVHGQARMMRAMIAWYQYTGDEVWKQRIDRMVEGLEKIVVHNGDYAYIPVHGFYPEEYLRSCYTQKGWKDTSEPPNEKFGEEGSLFNHQGHTAGALANWFVLTGNEHALRLSGQLVRFYTKPKFWADWNGGEYPIVEGAEHAHWQGHWHGYINTLRAILEYAVAANDERLKEFVRDGYNWARQKGLARIGYFDSQGCGCARIIGLAVKLSYHGVGDYWEDVDKYIRNHGTEMQFLPEDEGFLNSLSERKPPTKVKPGISCDNAVERAIGAFASGPDKTGFGLCCAAQGNLGLFYAWDGTLRNEDGTTQVNLLLNRASPWLDIDSYLPYEGKVVMRNKAAREAFVRIPLWVDRKAVRCRVGSKEVSNLWLGNRLRFSGLRPGDVLTIQFPMVERTEEWTIPRIAGQGPEFQSYTCKFRGNTLVEIAPPLVEGSPLYRRYYFFKDKAPMRRVTRFASSKVLRW